MLAKGPEPRRIPLTPLGFEPVNSKFLAAGSSLLTVHFVDDTHALVTFAVHRLLKRLPECAPDDDDHTIEALLVDTSHGSVVARTEWRLHDHRQYLWSLGQGVFLLRAGGVISTFAPMVNLERNQPFLAHTVMETDRKVEVVLLSHDRRLLTLETSARRRSGAGEIPDGDHPVQIDFYRIQFAEGSGAVVKVVHSGVARARTGVMLPNDSNGFVSALDQGRGQWAFDFNEYSGKKHELALFDSSCPPHTSLVSPSEFVALACPGGTERKLLAAFNLSGEEMWQQQFYRGYDFPVFAFAPAAGRFALSRMITNSGSGAGASLVPEQIDSQSITVYQTDSGKQLLTLDLTPAARAGGNFAISDDGLSFAVVRNDSLEIHALPELSSKDRAAVKRAFATAPQAWEGPVDFAVTAGATPMQQPAPLNVPAGTTLPAAGGMQAAQLPATGSSGAGSSPANAADSVALAPAADTSGTARPAAVAPPKTTTASGDPDPDHPEAPRARPTLYTMPTDSPHPAPPEAPQ